MPRRGLQIVRVATKVGKMEVQCVIGEVRDEVWAQWLGDSAGFQLKRGEVLVCEVGLK